MKKLVLFLLLLSGGLYCQAQIQVYIRLIDYKDKSAYLGAGGPNDHKNNPNNDELLLTTFSDDQLQTLNIGSQSAGAGAGKVTFNPLAFTKAPDGNSGLFFTMLASGTPFKFVEVSYYKTSPNSQLLFYKETFGLVAFKTVAVSAASCSSCAGVVENYTMEYGGKFVAYFAQKQDGSVGSPVGDGWNRVKNIKWDGTTPIN